MGRNTLDCLFGFPPFYVSQSRRRYIEMSAPNYADIMQRRTRVSCCSTPSNGYASYEQMLSTRKGRLTGECCPYEQITSVSVQSPGGGTNFTVGDLLKPTGGKPYGSVPTLFRVASVSGDITKKILSLTLISGGAYTVRPSTNTLSVVRSVIGGADPSGLNINITWSGTSICPC